MSLLKPYRTEQFPGVVIVGGGVSGCAAAIGAARTGAAVCLLEKSISLGGMSSRGLIANWNGYQPEYCPITRELDQRVEKIFGHGSTKALSHDEIKIAWEQWMDELGVDYRYECSVIDVVVESDTITGIYLATPNGIELLRGSCFIDATGDGVLAALAGVPFELGRAKDHLCQGASLSFEIGGISPNVKIDELPQCFGQTYPVPAGELSQLAKEHLTSPAGHVLLHYASESGVVTANMTNVVKFDPFSTQERTKAIALCHRQILEIIQFLQRYLPGFEHCYLHRMGDQLGIRESRHFQGKSCLTEEDIRNGRIFPDWIATRNRFGFDVHSVDGSGLDSHGDLHSMEQSIHGYTIPLGACLPTNRRQLYFCGRNISGTHLAHSSFRVMPICMNIGLGVGVAAALVLQQNCLPEQVNLEQLHQCLLFLGVSQP